MWLLNDRAAISADRPAWIIPHQRESCRDPGRHVRKTLQLLQVQTFTPINSYMRYDNGKVRMYTVISGRDVFKTFRSLWMRKIKALNVIGGSLNLMCSELRYAAHIDADIWKDSVIRLRGTSLVLQVFGHKHINMLTWWWRYMKSQRIIRVITVPPEGNMNVWTTLHHNPYNSCWDISVWTNITITKAASVSKNISTQILYFNKSTNTTL